jgi:hypothetical protein
MGARFGANRRDSLEVSAKKADFRAVPRKPLTAAAICAKLRAGGRLHSGVGAEEIDGAGGPSG